MSESDSQTDLVPAQGGGLTRRASVALAERGLSDLIRAESAEEWFQKAIKFYDEGALSEYFSCLQQALHLNPQHVLALGWLGFSYEVGIGVAKDLRQAEVWFRSAAEQGDAEAQTSLGWKYYGGELGDRDYAKATEWFHKAANQGDLEAQYTLGEIYYKGDGVPRDLKESAMWFRKVASRGHRNAQQYLDRILYEQ